MVAQFVKLVPYNPEWKNMFEVDKQFINMGDIINEINSVF
jgi:hypothetical protein